LLAQKSDNFREELDVPAVVTGNADRAGRLPWIAARTDVADRSMIAEINDFDPVPDELEVDRMIALSCPSQIGTAVRIRIGEAIARAKSLTVIV